MSTTELIQDLIKFLNDKNITVKEKIENTRELIRDVERIKVEFSILVGEKLKNAEDWRESGRLKDTLKSVLEYYDKVISIFLILEFMSFNGTNIDGNYTVRLGDILNMIETEYDKQFDFSTKKKLGMPIKQDLASKKASDDGAFILIAIPK